MSEVCGRFVAQTVVLMFQWFIRTCIKARLQFTCSHFCSARSFYRCTCTIYNVSVCEYHFASYSSRLLIMNSCEMPIIASTMEPVGQNATTSQLLVDLLRGCEDRELDEQYTRKMTSLFRNHSPLKTLVFLGAAKQWQREQRRETMLRGA